MDDQVSSIAAFALAAALITISPGLDTMLVLRTAAVEGWRRGAAAGAGILAGCLAWGMLVAIGLGAALAASQLLYRLLQAAGGLYLLYLGLGMIRGAGLRGGLPADDRLPPPKSWFRRGLVTNLLNPKMGVFYVTFLPPFIPPQAEVIPFTLLLTSIHVLLGALWFAALLAATRSLSAVIANRRNVTWIDRLCGSLLLVLGTKVVAGAAA